MNKRKMKKYLKIASATCATLGAHNIHTVAFVVGCISLLEALLDL
jgi:hypothetical protein